MTSKSKQIEKLIVKYVNASRKKRGISRLKVSRGLRFLARRHSRKMAHHRKIWHGNNVKLAAEHVSTGFLNMLVGLFLGGSSRSGENVAMMPTGNVRGIGQVRTVKQIANAFHKSWMNSPGHRRNVLDSKFSRIGVGIKKKGKCYYATQVFYG